jgi:hypothetical protein
VKLPHFHYAFFQGLVQRNSLIGEIFHLSPGPFWQWTSWPKRKKEPNPSQRKDTKESSFSRRLEFFFRENRSLVVKVGLNGL